MKNKEFEICKEKVFLGERDALQQHFLYKSSKFSKNSNSLMPGVSNLAILVF